MALFQSPNIVTDNLVFCVDAANTKSYSGSGTSWKDISGKGNDGTLTNGPTFNNDNGGSIVFDGSNDYTELTFNTEFDNISIEAWAIRDTLDGFLSIFGKYGSGSDTGYELLFNDSAGVRLHTSSDSIDSTGSLITGVWYHIVGTYDGTTSKIYINSSLNASGAKSHNSNSQNWRIGLSRWGGNYYNGNISIVKLYNKALTAAEVLQNYNAYKGRYV